ncbi:MAG: cell division protein FtsA [Candidatus Pacebacteria bacterium]|nr:cell division protein FtsA [Candidatus Paceibacterota bacterium]
MSRGDILIGIDIGSSVIRTIISQKQEEDIKPLILGVGTAFSTGINNGVIVDIEETINAITKSKEAAERTAGIPIEHAYVSINGNHISSQFSKGVVAVSRADGEVSEEDVNRVITASQAISMPNNKDIITVIPCGYTIDGQEQIKDPIGMNGVRLEINALIVEGMAPYMKNLYKCVQRCGIDIDDLVFAPLAASKAVLSKRQMELGVVEIDIGKASTGVSIFEDGGIIHSAVVPIGAGHITNDIAIGLRTSIDVAEKIKLEYGTTLVKETNKKDRIDLSKISKDEEGIFTRKYIAEIIEARMEEIFTMVDKELKKIDRSGMLPAGAVITGGGAKITGAITTAKEVLRLPAQIGFPMELNGIVDRVDDPSFVTSVGLIMWEPEDVSRHSSGKWLPDFNNIMQKTRKIFKTFLP